MNEGYTQILEPVRIRIQDKRYPRRYKKMQKRGIKVRLCKYRAMRKALNPKPFVFWATACDTEGILIHL